LVIEKETIKDGRIAKQQFPVYFVSEVLTGSKKYYSEIEKICYAVIMSAKKLRHYFEAHTIKVLTNQPLNDIFDNRHSSGRINRWAMELSKYVVDFEKRSTLKSHILADFLVEWTEPNSPAEGSAPKSSWLIYYDRAYDNVGAGVAAVLIYPPPPPEASCATQYGCNSPTR
jgi:hypothetical protein